MLSNQINIKSLNINLIRFLAAVSVIWEHSFMFAENLTEPFQKVIHGATNLGFGGVNVCILFFISGLYVTKSLSKSKGFWHFLYKRVIRLFPQLIIIVILTVFILGPLMTVLSPKAYFSDSSTYKYLLNCLLYPVYYLLGVFQNNIYDSAVNGPLWTLPVEFLAYLSLALAMQISLFTKNKVKQKHLHMTAVILTFSALLISEYVLRSAFLARVMRPVVMFYIGSVFYDYADKIKLRGSICAACGILLIISNCLNCCDVAIVLLLPYMIAYIGLGIRQIPFNGTILLVSYEMYLLGAPIQQSLIACFGGSMDHSLNFVLALIIDIILAFGLYFVTESLNKKFFLNKTA